MKEKREAVENPVSLAPLSPEEALLGLLRVPFAAELKRDAKPKPERKSKRKSPVLRNKAGPHVE